jgi:hypothetical protein
MSEQFDRLLAAADPSPAFDENTVAAVSALSNSAARNDRRHRRVVVPAVLVGSFLALSAGGAAAATAWGAWTYVDEPDISFSREWVAVDGEFLGTCESRLVADDLPADARAAALDYLGALDVDALDPDPEVVAGWLNASGRLDEFGSIIPGVDVTDFELSHDGAVIADSRWSNTRILQDGLVQVVFGGMADSVLGQFPELDQQGITSRVETQCTTDPDYSE